MNKKQYLVFVMILLLIPLVNAVGISPGKKVINFEPNQEREITITIFNPQGNDFKAYIFSRGDLSQHIKLSTNTLNFSKGETQKSFSYRISLPERFQKPGTHGSEIVVTESPPVKQGETFITTSIALIHQVQVNVPYPGKYAEANLNILTKGNEINFILRTSNLGEQDINSAQASISVYDYKNNLITTIKTGEKSIKSKQRKELTANWDANYSYGNYKADAILDYDGITLNLQKPFSVGDFFIRLLSITANKQFRLGDIAKFNILVENLANENVSQLISEIILFGKGKNQIANITSVPVDVSAKSKKELLIYWDTKNVNIGNYTGKLILIYDNKELENEIKLIVNKDSINIEIIGLPLPAAIKPQPMELPVSIIILIILIILNLLFYIYLKKFKKK